MAVCPKCGKELIIGSTLCTDCDVLEENKQKPRRKLSKQGKMILGAVGAVLILVLIVCLSVFAMSFRIRGEENGNGINLSYAEKIENTFYYSDGGNLCSVDKRFKNSEVIDNGGEIYCLNECNKALYYIKDNVLCKYDPDKRVKSEIIKLPSEQKTKVLAKGKNDLYFAISGGIYKFSAKQNQLTETAKGEGVISGDKIYLFENDGIYKTKLSGGEKELLCGKGEFEKPLFIKGRHIYVVDYKEMKVYTINKNNGKKELVMSCADYEKISDVSKVNISGKYLLVCGADGIYKVNIKNGKSKLLGETGYVNSICVEDGFIFSRRFEGASYFSDMSGKIRYKTENGVHQE